MDLIARVTVALLAQPGRAAGDAANGGLSEVGDAGPSRDTLTLLKDTLWSIWQDFVQHIPAIVAGLLVVVATWVAAAIISRVARRMLARSRLRGSLQELARRFLVLVVWAVGLSIAAMIVFEGLTPARALAALGLGSIAIGFAFKDIFENFFAGVLILWKFPFENGDYISCQGIEGEVEDVTIRNTMIRKVTGELVVMPNGMLFKSPVDILTNHPLRRQTVIAGVAYGEDVDQSREVIREAVEACESVSDHKPVQVFAQEFASSSINFEVAWWTGPTPLAQRQSRDEAIAAIKRALDAAGIEIPFPYRTLTFKEPLETVSRSDGTK